MVNIKEFIQSYKVNKCLLNESFVYYTSLHDIKAIVMNHFTKKWYVELYQCKAPSTKGISAASLEECAKELFDLIVLNGIPEEDDKYEKDDAKDMLSGCNLDFCLNDQEADEYAYAWEDYDGYVEDLEPFVREIEREYGL